MVGDRISFLVFYESKLVSRVDMGSGGVCPFVVFALGPKVELQVHCGRLCGDRRGRNVFFV